MADAERRRSGGKAARTETVTVRLDPKLRYLAELAARKQRRSLSSYIEWAVEDSLSRVALQEDSNYRTTVGDEASALWDVDEADRFAKLALRYPDLLTHEEQVRWKLIRENGAVWLGKYNSVDRWIWNVDENSLRFDQLREHWDAFCKAAETGGQGDLPQWRKTKVRGGYGTPPPAPEAKKSTGFDDMDDDIPF